MAETNQPHTVSYSQDVKGWPSFYSFLPDYMAGMNGFFYSWNGGNLYRHNTNQTRNNYYGVQYSSTITSVFNAEPTMIKLFKTMSYESDDKWECTSLFSDLNTGSMLSTYFEQKEGEWFTYLRENEGTVECTVLLVADQLELGQNDSCRKQITPSRQLKISLNLN